MTPSGIKSKAVFAAVYMYVVPNWSFSKGDRVGNVQKFSEKGWVSKALGGRICKCSPYPKRFQNGSHSQFETRQWLQK